MTKNLTLTIGIATLAMAPFITGCATKKFVRTSVAPINQKVGELDQTTQTHGKGIEELGRGVAKADERAQGADAHALEADRKAVAAGEEAKTARGEAAEGKALGQQGIARANEVEKSINGRIDGLANYKMVTTEQVLFKVNRFDLDKDSMAILDAAAGKVAGMKNYVIELQGFTDTTGNKNANIELSKKRADAVVRYLTIKHNVPLYRVHVAGFGDENSVADNKTRDGRKQNRRVEMKVYVAGATDNAQVSSLSEPTR